MFRMKWDYTEPKRSIKTVLTSLFMIALFPLTVTVMLVNVLRNALDEEVFWDMWKEILTLRFS